MFARSSVFTLLSFALLVTLVAGCNPVEPSKEVKELKTKTAEEVAFTYDAIMKMSDDDLAKNIKSVSDRLLKKRAGQPRSVAGATMGSSEQPKSIDDSTPVPAVAGSDDVSVPYLALPLVVMQQVAESRK